MATDWTRQWAALLTVTAAPDAGKELQIGDEDPPNDVINRTVKQLNAFLEELAAGGLGTNIITNGSFERWFTGISNQAPDGFSLKGTPTDVSRDTGERDGFGGTFAAKITSNGAGNEGLTITLSDLKASTPYFVSVRAKVTAGDTARIWSTGGGTNIDEDTTSTSFVTLSGEIITDGTPTNVVINFGSNTATDIVWFDKLMIQEGEVPAIFITHPNDEHTFRGALVKRTSAQAITTGTSTFVIFDAETYDTDNIHDNSTNPSRLTVPSEVSKVKILANIKWENDNTGNRDMAVWKNNSINFDGAPRSTIIPVNFPGTGTHQNLTSPVLVVTAGDYFELKVYQNSGGDLNIADVTQVWFAMEIIE